MEILRLKKTCGFKLIRLLLLLSVFVSCVSPSRHSHYSVRLTSPIQERECGVIPKIKLRKYTNGILSQFGQAPWQAGIFDAQDGLFFCSGTLISSRHVITSAACLMAISSPSSLEVRLGDWDISWQDSPYETYDHFSTSVNKVIINSESSVLESQPKIAILKLQNHVDFLSYPHIAPLCLPPALPGHKNVRQPYHKCIATGWGAANSLISDSPEDSYSSETSGEPADTFPNQLQAEDSIYFTPILTGQSLLSLSKDFSQDTVKKLLHKYETKIIVPDVFASVNGSDANNQSEANNGGFGQLGIQRGNNDTTTKNLAANDKARIIDPVEEYMDMPEYITIEEGDDSLAAHDSGEIKLAAIPVETTTHKRITLSDMPKGDESFEIMESRRHDVAAPIDFSTRFQITTDNAKYDLVPELPVTEPTVRRRTSLPPYESGLYRHKQKYKQGRIASRNRQPVHANRDTVTKTGVTNEELQLNSDAHSVAKRSTRRFLSTHDITRNLIDTSQIMMNSHVNFSSVLKTVDVIFKTKCKHMRSTTPEIISVSSYEKTRHRTDLPNSKNQNEMSCIRPKNEKQVPNFCMLDIGSPITCASVRGASPQSRSSTRKRRVSRSTSNLFKTYHHISRHVFPTKSRKQDAPQEEKFEFEVEETKHYKAQPKTTKMYLTGVVTWKDACQEEDMGNAAPDFGATEVANIQELLPFILDSLQK